MVASQFHCRSCGATLREQVLDLGPQPASDAFPIDDGDPAHDPRWPLELWLCGQCHLVQLGGDDAPVPEMPLAVESATSKAHSARLAASTVSLLALSSGATVVEFASHHGGSWLNALHAAGLRPPDKDAALADLVVDVHGLAHEPQLAEPLHDRASHVAPGGWLVLEFHHLLPLVLEGQYDTVRHGHPVYLSLTALTPALASHGFIPLHAQPNPAYGGSLLVVAGRPDEHEQPDPSVAETMHAEHEAGLADPDRLRQLQRRAEQAATALHTWLIDARGSGRRVLGYGAPSKAAVLLCSSKVGPELLPFTADLSAAKHGRRIPGAGATPIRSPDELLAARPDDVLVVFAPGTSRMKCARSSERSSRGVDDLCVPVPQPTVLDS